MKNTFLIVLLLALASTSCKKEDSDTDPIIPNPTNSVFKFFINGATWNYDTYDNDGGAHIVQTISITSLNAQNYAVVNHNMGGFYSYNDEWYADNTKFSMLCSQAGSMMLVFTDADPSVGEFWSYSWSDSTHTVYDTCRVLAVNESVTVPAGTFTNCVKIRETTSEDPVFFNDMWISFQYGLIKSEATTQQDYPNIVYQDLQSHNLQ